MMLTLMVTSKGVAAVPRASLVILSGTLATFGLPLEGVAVILGVDELMDMAPHHGQSGRQLPGHGGDGALGGRVPNSAGLGIPTNSRIGPNVQERRAPEQPSTTGERHKGHVIQYSPRPRATNIPNKSFCLTKIPLGDARGARASTRLAYVTFVPFLLCGESTGTGGENQNFWSDPNVVVA